MLQVMITGLYNRGQQDEYVELEAAGRCSLYGLMLLRYVNNPEGFPVPSQTRVFTFPETNVRKGNRIRLYTSFSPVKKLRTPDGVTYHFSWNLEAPVWDGTHVVAEVVQCSERMSFMPSEPISDLPSPQERGKLMPISEETVKLALSKAAVEGRFHVLGEKGNEIPIRITGAPAEAQPYIDAGDFEGLMRFIRESRKSADGSMKSKRKKQ